MKITPLLTDLITTDMKAGNTVFLSGNPGIGKTSVAKAVADHFNSQAFLLSVNLLADKADLTGARLTPTDSGSFVQQFFPHVEFQKAIDYAKKNPSTPVVVILDEINRTNPDVTSAALSITTERKIGDQKLPDNISIITTGNIRGNVVALDSASLSRFAIYQVEPDATTLVAYLDSREDGNKPLNPWIKSVLVANPETVYQEGQPNSFSVETSSNDDDDDESTTATILQLADAAEEMTQLTTPRTIEGLSDWIDIITNNMSDMSKLQELFQTPAEIGGRENVTLLHEAIEAHVGNTRLSTLVIGEIARAFATPVTNTANAGPIVNRPPFWDKIADAKTVTDLEVEINNLSDTEKATALLYALISADNNVRIVEILANAITGFDSSQNQLFVRILNQSNGFNPSNLDAFVSANTPFSNGLAQIVQMLRGE